MSNSVVSTQSAKFTQLLVVISLDLNKAIFLAELNISPQVEIKILKRVKPASTLSLVFWPPEMVARTSVFVCPNTDKYVLEVIWVEMSDQPGLAFPRSGMVCGHRPSPLSYNINTALPPSPRILILPIPFHLCAGPFFFFFSPFAVGLSRPSAGSCTPLSASPRSDVDPHQASGQQLRRRLQLQCGPLYQERLRQRLRSTFAADTVFDAHSRP